MRLNRCKGVIRAFEQTQEQKESVQIIELKEKLKTFTGTENYYKYIGGLLLTEGVKFMAEECGAFWLLDILASYQIKFKNIPFQIWNLRKDGDKAKVTLKEDSNCPILAEQEIEYTDFPLEEIELWLINGVVLLPSEY